MGGSLAPFRADGVIVAPDMESMTLDGQCRPLITYIGKPVKTEINYDISMSQFEVMR